MAMIETTRDQAALGAEAADSELATVEPGAEEASGPALISHVVDFYHRYPGESVTFYTRLDVRKPLANLTLRVTIPPEVELLDSTASTGRPGLRAYVETEEDRRFLVWPLTGPFQPGSRYEFQAAIKIGSLHRDMSLESRAVLTDSAHATLASETAAFSVWLKGRYLRYLPELYEQDDFMGRFLMLFESFWKPVDTQVRSVHHYLDPRMTPPAFLPWLASWLDLQLDEGWPEARQRQLVRWAIALHRSRGTKWGLQRHLEIYTGQKARIVEHRAKNFQLGTGARLGPGIALGKNNRPHTFAVHLRLPALDHIQDEAERARQERLRRRTIESIIEMQKPAHTLYTLNLEIVPAEAPEAPAVETEVVDQEPEAEEDRTDARSSIWFQLDD